MTTMLALWHSLQRAAGVALYAVLVVVRLLGRLLLWILTALVGRWRWEMPPWLRWSTPRARAAWHHARRDPVPPALLTAAAAFGVAALVVVANRPRPHYAEAGIEPPGLTEYDEKGIKDIKPLRVVFSEPVAPLRQLQKTIAGGIDMSPAVAGAWTWENDKVLRFTPSGDWPIDAAFTVRLARQGVLAPDARIERYRFDFRSRPFTAEISESQFYQDPRDPNLKKLVATVKFSHPVDAAEFEKHVSLEAATDAGYLGLTGDSRHFTVLYDKFKLAAFVHSAALPVPRDDTSMTMYVEKGVRAARGGNTTLDRLAAVVVIPGRTSLRFAEARMTVVDNARYEPEQILVLKSSSPVAERAFTGKITMQLLPERSPKQRPDDPKPYDWRQEGQEIGRDVLARSEAVSLNYVPSEDGGNTAHGFRFLAPVGRYVRVTVSDGIEGTGGYISGTPFTATIRVRPYNRALTFLGQGALLSMSGDRKVGFLVRDISQVTVEVARVLPNQLQHLAPQMWDFSKPSLYGNLEDKLVERFTATRDYDAPPGKPTYDSIDIAEYMQQRTGGRRGLFLLHVRTDQPARVDDEDDEEESDDPEEEADVRRADDEDGALSDTRLVLVTDLGMIVKQAKDGSRDVFVQSIRTGLPAAGVTVDLVGSNGEPALSAVTDAMGRARIPPGDRLYREKTPVLMLAHTESDMSFLPFNSNGRTLNLSRFDTGGIENASSAAQLSAYLFTDRGIYRPGESTHIGVIARTADWQSPLGGLPIDFEISDPQGLVVNKTTVPLSAAAFDEFTYTTQPTSQTGTYQAVAYLTRQTRQGRRRETLGSTSFRVQEFEPDRMKIQLELSSQPVEGWLRPDDVHARVTVAHLFGEAASDRRVDGELSLSAALPRFARYADYRFQIGERLNEPYREALAATTTNDTGNAELMLDLKRFVGRAYRLNVLARAFEAEGGRSVAAETSVIVSDAAYLVGVRGDGNLSFVQRNSARESQWMAVNQQLAPVAASNLTLEWVQRKYVSVLTQQGNGTLAYVSRLREVVRDSRSVSIAAGGSRFPLPTTEPGDFALVLRDAAGAELNVLSYSVAGQANLSRSLERNTELQVQLNKSGYAGGETIDVSIRAPYTGAGLITVERDRIYAFTWFKATTTSSVQHITLPKDFEGNGYVSVQFLRDPASDELFMSPLSYGVAPFSPNLEARTEPLALTAPRQAKPGTAITLHVAPGEASRVLVVAVDEGILQVARYKNPDPLAFFFQKRMLEVETSQILDLILPDFKRFQALAAAGGDADSGFERHLNPFARKRKAPVAFWSSILDVGPDGRDVRYTVPDYFNGRLRVFAIAASARRVAVADAATEVAADFVLTPNVPAMVAPGDEFLVSVGVFNNIIGQSGAIHVEARTGGGFSVLGPSGVDLQIADKKEGVAEFRIKANAALGAAPITFSARRAATSASMEESVSLRPASAYRTQLTLGRIDNSAATVPVTRDMFPERRSVEGSVSSIPLVWAPGLITYLDNYEYSCTEQLVSKGMAAMVVLARPALGTVAARTAHPLAPTFSTLRSRLNVYQGYGLWSSSPQTADFPTIYAVHFLLDARDLGNEIPVDLLEANDAWLSNFALTPASTLADARMRAYAVYLLVRQGRLPGSAIANVEQELTQRYPQAWQTDLAAAYLAATYRLMQRTADAERIIQNVPWSAQKNNTGEEIYYDGVIHDAQLLYLIARHFPNRLAGVPPAALEGMATAVSQNRATSLSAGYTLMALNAFATAAGSRDAFGISEIDRQQRERALTLTDDVIFKAAVSADAARVQFARKTATPGYYALAQSGYDRNPPAAEVTRGVEIVREFVDSAGTPITRVKVGEEFFVRLRLRATARDREWQLAIVDILPGGVEPVLELRPAPDSGTPDADPAQMRRAGSTGSLPIGVSQRSDWTPEHVDVRDDRVVLYGDATRNAGTFTYRVRATNAGTFQSPPAFVEGMYNRAITATSKASMLEVVKP